jgi:hypothetical protein
MDNSNLILTELYLNMVECFHSDCHKCEKIAIPKIKPGAEFFN